MNWNPVTVMTLVDLIAVAVAIIAAVRVFRYRRQELDPGVLVTLGGLAIWGLFSLFDLASLLRTGFDENHYLAHGSIIGTIAVALGLVMSHSHQQAAATQVEHFIEFINHLPDPAMLLSDQKVAAINQPMEDLIYRNREDLIGRDPYDLWDMLEFNLAPREEVLEHLHREGSWWFISKLNKHDGTTGHAEVKVALMDPERGHIIVFLSDITDRITAERRLQESETRLATSQAIAGLGYWHYHLADESVQWSTELLRIFGLNTPESEVKYPNDRSRWQLIHPDDESFLRGRMDEALESGVEPPETSFRIIRPDDEVRHVRVRFGIVKDQAGAVEDLYAVVQDITEFVHAEERLRHAQRMEAVGALTGGISHDFNNLLQIIMGNAELLEGRVDPAVADFLSAIRRAARRGSELTQLLLAYSRRQHLEPKTVNVNHYVSEMLPLLRRTLGEAISIESHPAEDLEYCRIDPGQLENCILNLAINAQHAMPNGGTLTVETRNTTLAGEYTAGPDEILAGNYVQVTISDTGIGMSEAIRNKAFEPFFTTKDTGMGSGLGLSMVYGFIKQSGGHVELDSTEGNGTSVRLFLPVANREQVGTVDEDHAIEDRLFAGKALLVEDDPQVATLTRRFLESLGLDVVTAESITSVRKHIHDGHRFDLLLTDVVLPGGIGGPAVVEEVKQRYPEIRVLLMSGYTDNALSTESGLLLLNKPFTRADLAEKLNKVFVQSD